MTNKQFNERLDAALSKLIVGTQDLDFRKAHPNTQQHHVNKDEAKAALIALVDEVNTAVIGDKTISLSDIYGNDWRNNYGYNETQVRDAANHLQRKALQKAKDIIHGK